MHASVAAALVKDKRGGFLSLGSLGLSLSKWEVGVIHLKQTAKLHVIYSAAPM